MAVFLFRFMSTYKAFNCKSYSENTSQCNDMLFPGKYFLNVILFLAIQMLLFST